MKRLFALLLASVIMLSLSACGVTDLTDKNGVKAEQGLSVQSGTGQEGSAAVSRDRAIELALNAAGFTADEVRDLEAEPDRERGGTYWEVDFEAGGYEYSYDIDSATGEVVKADREFD